MFLDRSHTRFLKSFFAVAEKAGFSAIRAAQDRDRPSFPIENSGLLFFRRES